MELKNKYLVAYWQRVLWFYTVLYGLMFARERELDQLSLFRTAPGIVWQIREFCIQAFWAFVQGLMRVAAIVIMVVIFLALLGMVLVSPLIILLCMPMFLRNRQKELHRMAEDIA